jgi:S1-C subfamily serine protease
VEKETLYEGFDVQRRGFAAARCLLDERRNVLEEQLLTKDRKPTTGRDGYARIRYERDASGQVQRVRLLDLAGEASDAEVYVLAVLPGTEAARAGVQGGDVLVSFAGRPVRDWYAMPAQLPPLPKQATTRAARSHELVVLRNGQRVTIRLGAGRVGLVLSYRAVAASSSQPTSRGVAAAERDR